MQESLGEELKRFCVGVLSSGDILFFYTESGRQWLLETEEVELHWGEDQKLWRVSPRGGDGSNVSWFELPGILLAQWTEMKSDREKVLNLKEDYFKRIYVMGRDSAGNSQLRMLRLSKAFIEEARRKLSRFVNNVDQ